MKLLRSGFLILRREYNKIQLQNLNIETKAKASSDLRNLLINMPKEQVHVPILKSARNQKRDGVTKHLAGFITLQVLGNGSKGSPSSLYVFTDQTRYIFNCGEGTQRLAHEHKMKLARLEHIFLTSKEWSRIGGLPGIALTVQDIGVPSITLHGPTGLEHLFEATKRFVVLRDLNIHVANCVNGNFSYFEDHIMKVEYVPLLRRRKETDPADSADSDSVKTSSNEGSTEEDNIDYYKPLKGFKRHLEITQDEENSDSDTKKTKVEFTIGNRLDEYTICFICKPKEKPGALEIAKCVALGVPAGPLLGKLKAGEDVVLPNGVIVKAKDVCSPDCPGPIFIVMDCPNEEYLDSIVESDSFVPHQDTASRVEDVASVVVHFTPQHILLNQKYIGWMKKFRSSTNHLFINGLCEGMGSEAVHRLQYKLNILDQSMFPVLNETSPFLKSTLNFADSVFRQRPELQELSDLAIIMSRTLLKYGLRPVAGLDTTALVAVDQEEYVNEAMKMEYFPEALKKMKSRILKLKQANEEVQEYPNLTFLGTGSCIPNKTRNTSGILVEINEDTSMIMDCGEGTYGQIVRFFGNEESDVVMTKLKAIYISHLHADHHLGLMNLLQGRAVAFKNLNLPLFPLYLIAPQQIKTWLHLFHKCFERIESFYILVPNASVQFNKSMTDKRYDKEALLNLLCLSKLETVEVRHCPNAYGVAITGLNGWKITYSGDTMPCDYLVTLGRGSDVLIHEATMEDELKDEAQIKMHSTTSEAIDVGIRMEAKFILLTHFSQRYSRLPKIDGGLARNIGIAFDSMRVRLSDLPKIPLIYPALKCMFAEHYEEMEQKTAKKLMKREREKAKASMTSA